MKKSLLQKNEKRIALFCAAVFCCGLFALFTTGVFAAAGTKITTYINQTLTYEKGTATQVLTETEAKAAGTAGTDLLMLAAGRDTDQTIVTDDEYATYLGYVNYNVRKGTVTNNSVTLLRMALAVNACGGNPGSVGTDDNGNNIDLLYRGIYSRQITTLNTEGSEALAYALIVLDANNVNDADLRASGSKVTREDLKTNLVAAAVGLSEKAVPDISLSGLVLQALAPYYLTGEQKCVDAVNALLENLKNWQAGNGAFKDSCTATARIMEALAVLKIDPAENAFFNHSVYDGLLVFYNEANGGFGATAGAVSGADATNSARCALVAYWCFREGTDFYDFSAVKAHALKNISNPSANTNPSSSSGSSSSSNSTKSSTGSNSSSSLSASRRSRSDSSSSNSSSSSSSSSGSSSTIASSTQGQGSLIAKSVFDDLLGKDTNYIYEGIWGDGEPYTISFNGLDITNPMDFNAGITNIVTHQTSIDVVAPDAEYIHFEHSGAFPGKAAVTITVALTDGIYQCYHFDENSGTFTFVGTVSVSAGMFSFSVSEGGDYFLTANEIDTSRLALDRQNTVDGVVPASFFEEIQGHDVDLTLEGVTDLGTPYTVVFNGLDITSPCDFDMQINESGESDQTLRERVNRPWILHFAQEGELPGKATVSLSSSPRQGTALATAAAVRLTLLEPSDYVPIEEALPWQKSVTYGLYHYDKDVEQGSYVDDVIVGEARTSFTIYHCSDYYIAAGRDATGVTAAVHSVFNDLGLLLCYIVSCGVPILAVIVLLIRRWRKEELARKKRAARRRRKRLKKAALEAMIDTYEAEQRGAGNEARGTTTAQEGLMASSGSMPLENPATPGAKELNLAEIWGPAQNDGTRG